MKQKVDGAMFKMEDSFDEAILGQWEDRYVYDAEAVIDMLEKFNGWDTDQALEWFEFNIENAMGEGYPIFVHQIEDQEWKAPEPVMPFTHKEIYDFFVKGVMDSGYVETQKISENIAGHVYGMYRQIHERYVEAIRLETNSIMAEKGDASDKMLDMMNLLRRLD